MEHFRGVLHVSFHEFLKLAETSRVDQVVDVLDLFLNFGKSRFDVAGQAQVRLDGESC